METTIFFKCLTNGCPGCKLTCPSNMLGHHNILPTRWLVHKDEVGSDLYILSIKQLLTTINNYTKKPTFRELDNFSIQDKGAPPKRKLCSCLD